MSVCGHLGNYNTSSTRTHVRFQFSTHAAAGGNVAPSSGFENTDIRIYKAADGAALSDTQRSSSSGIAMSSPFDSLTGFHSVDIDLTDNADSGFYAAGSFYSVVLAPDETVDSATITGIVLCTFEIGVPAVNTTQFGGTAGTFASGRPEVNMTHIAGSSVSTSTAQLGVNVVNFGGSAGTFASGLPAVNATQFSGSTTAADNAEVVFATDFATNYSTTNDKWQVEANVTHAAGTAWGSGAITAGSIASDAITAAKIANGAIDAATFAADVDAEARGWLGMSTNDLDAQLSSIDGTATDISEATTNMYTAFELDGSVYRLTTNALEQAPSGSGASAADIADAVWTEAIADHSGVSGSTAEALSAAGAAGDPWITSLPGSYTSGQAGYIIGTNLNATVSSRATQTSVDTIDGIVDSILDDTGTAGVVVASGSKTGYSLTQSFPSNFASLGINASGHVSRVTLADTVTTLTGHTPQTGDAYARLGAPAGASVSADIATIDSNVDAILVDTGTTLQAELDGIQADTEDIQSRLPTALVSGRIDATIDGTGMEAGALAAILAAGDIDGYSLEEALKLGLAVLAGEVSGAGTGTILIRAADDSKVRLTATTTAEGNRTALTLDATG